MQHDLHHHEAVQACSHIIDHDTHSFRQPLELTYRWRFHDIERSKKYKAQQQRLPCHGRCNQSDELACDFVDHYKLRIFHTAGPRHLSRSWNSGENGGESEQHSHPGLPAG